MTAGSFCAAPALRHITVSDPGVRVLQWAASGAARVFPGRSWSNTPGQSPRSNPIKVVGRSAVGDSHFPSAHTLALSLDELPGPRFRQSCVTSSVSGVRPCVRTLLRCQYCADGPQPPADHAWVLLLLPLLAGLVGQWRLRRDNHQLRRQLAQVEAHHLKEVARLQHARDAAVRALCGKLKSAKHRALIEAQGQSVTIADLQVEKVLLQQKLALAQEAEKLAASRLELAIAQSVSMLLAMAAMAINMDRDSPHMWIEVSNLDATTWSLAQWKRHEATVTEWLCSSPETHSFYKSPAAAVKYTMTRLLEVNMLPAIRQMALTTPLSLRLAKTP